MGIVPSKRIFAQAHNSSIFALVFLLLFKPQINIYSSSCCRSSAQTEPPSYSGGDFLFLYKANNLPVSRCCPNPESFCAQ